MQPITKLGLWVATKSLLSDPDIIPDTSLPNLKDNDG